VLLLPEVMGST